MKNQAFYDDADSYLNRGADSDSKLSRRAADSTAASSFCEALGRQLDAHKRALFEMGVTCDENGRPHDVQKIVPRFPHAYEALSKMMRRGMHWRDALDYLERQPDPNPLSFAEEVDEDEMPDGLTGAVILWLMQAPVTPDRKSSSNGKKRGKSAAPDPTAIEQSLRRRMMDAA